MQSHLDGPCIRLPAAEDGGVAAACVERAAQDRRVAFCRLVAIFRRFPSCLDALEAELVPKVGQQQAGSTQLIVRVRVLVATDPKCVRRRNNQPLLVKGECGEKLG
eukprot:7389123-Prymnesium_polylepis.3